MLPHPNDANFIKEKNIFRLLLYITAYQFLYLNIIKYHLNKDWRTYTLYFIERLFNMSYKMSYILFIFEEVKMSILPGG